MSSMTNISVRPPAFSCSPSRVLRRATLGSRQVAQQRSEPLKRFDVGNGGGTRERDIRLERGPTLAVALPMKLGRECPRGIDQQPSIGLRLDLDAPPRAFGRRYGGRFHGYLAVVGCRCSGRPT